MASDGGGKGAHASVDAGALFIGHSASRQSDETWGRVTSLREARLRGEGPAAALADGGGGVAAV